MSLLDVRNLRLAIGGSNRELHPVDGISFTVQAGETLGIVGESGSGKSLTGLSITGLLPAGVEMVAGDIRLDGELLADDGDLTWQRVRGAQVGMVFQDPLTSLNPTMRIGAQVREAVLAHDKLSRRAAEARTREMLAQVGLSQRDDRYDAYPHQLSGGMRQRVMIAMAVASRPKLLIADEPTTALDVTVQARVLDVIDQLKAELGMSVILITHDMGVIAERTDRVLVMYAGTVAEICPTADLFSSSRHRYTQALLRAIPQLDHDPRQPLVTIAGTPPELRDRPKGCAFAPRCFNATTECSTTRPQLIASGSPKHSFACWHPVQDAEPELTAGADVADEELVDDSGERGEVLLSLENVSMTFGGRSGAGAVHALTDVSLQLRRGETIGVVGESGSGKTTLGRISVGLLSPTAGSATFNGEKVFARRRSGRRRIGRSLQMMFQDPYSSLDPRMRIREIVREPLRIQRAGTRAEQSSAIAALLEETGLSSGALHKLPHEFSGGQRQRIGLARSLALNPAVIVADEPVSALDVSVRSQILNMMKRIQRLHGLSYLFVSHDLSVVQYVADRVVVMFQGRIIEEGSRAQIFGSPAHPYTRALLDAVPKAAPNQRQQQERSPEPCGPHGDPETGCPYRTRCRLAQQLCRDERPSLRRTTAGQNAACHFPLGGHLGNGPTVASTTNPDRAGERLYIEERATIQLSEQVLPAVRALHIPMADGVRIAADIWGVVDDERRPTIVMFTRYWRSDTTAERVGGATADAIKYFTRVGYVFVVVDVRGTGASFGVRATEWPVAELRDYGEVIDWIAARPWSNGAVATMGTSYPGNAAELAALSRSAALRAVVPRFSDFTEYLHGFRPGGVSNRVLSETWIEVTQALDANNVAERSLGDHLVPGVHVRPVDDDPHGEMLTAALDERRRSGDTSAIVRSLQFSDDPFALDDPTITLESISPSTLWRDIDAGGIPSMHWGSWFDGGTADGCLTRFVNYRSPMRVVIGAWNHGATTNADPYGAKGAAIAEPPPVDQFAAVEAFLNPLMGSEPATNQGRVIEFLTLGRNQWRSTEVWPPADVVTSVLYLGPDRTLAAEPPAKGGDDRYEVDPTASSGTANRWHTQLGEVVDYGDRRDQATRVLTYDSPPLKEATEITGSPVVALRLLCNKPDAALIVYLEDVAPDGTVTMLCDGVLRMGLRGTIRTDTAYLGPVATCTSASYRPIPAGEPIDVQLTLNPISVLVRAGHRLRLSIAGADDGTFAPIDPRPDEPTTFTVQRDSHLPSLVSLPIACPPAGGLFEEDPRRQEPGG